MIASQRSLTGTRYRILTALSKKLIVGSRVCIYTGFQLVVQLTPIILVIPLGVPHRLMKDDVSLFTSLNLEFFLTWVIRSIKVTLSLRVSLLVPFRLLEEVTECIFLGTTMIVSAWFSLSSPAAAGTICIIRSMGHREYTTCTDAPYYQLTPFL